MTFGRLVWEISQYAGWTPYPELALQVAFDELEADARSKQAERAKRLTNQLQRRGGG